MIVVGYVITAIVKYFFNNCSQKSVLWWHLAPVTYLNTWLTIWLIIFQKSWSIESLSFFAYIWMSWASYSWCLGFIFGFTFLISHHHWAACSVSAWWIVFRNCALNSASIDACWTYNRGCNSTFWCFVRTWSWDILRILINSIRCHFSFLR